jgi:hypothetical protein
VRMRIKVVVCGWKVLYATETGRVDIHKTFSQEDA